MQLNGINGLTNGSPKKKLTFFKSPHYHLMVYICVYDIQTANIPKHHSNKNINTSVCINEKKNQ